MKKTLLDRIASEESPARSLVSKAWRFYAKRGISTNDNHQGLEKLYALPDPWDMGGEREQSRFRQTNALIAGLLGPVDTLLEIGCGEGHQSAHLVRLCNRLDGLDVSVRAVERAARRLPQGRFGVGEVTALPWPAPAGGRYDLVVACEVLYYLADVRRAVEAMSQLGRACLVTFFCPSARVVARHLQDLPGVRRGWIYHDPYAWLWAYWQPHAEAHARHTAAS